MALYVDIEKTFGKFHLRCAFEVGHETLALLGASGSGKSLTLRCIAGIETPDKGRIELDGHVLFDSEKKINLSPQKRNVGYLFQSYALFPHMSVAQNIGIGVRDNKNDRKRIVGELVASMYLEGLEHKFPSQLSGGQQQRVALARILASRPRMIMLDEPFSALDSYLRWQLEQEIVRVIDGYKGTTLFVSHNRDEVYRLCDRIVVIDSGKSQDAAEKTALFSSPDTLSAAQLTGCKNISKARKAGEYEIFAEDWGVTLKTDMPVPTDVNFVGVRAHYINAHSKKMSGTFECEVMRIVDNPFSTVAMLKNVLSGDDKAGESHIRIELEKEKWSYKVGDIVHIEIPEYSVMPLK